MFVRFPASSREFSENVWMDAGLKEIEAALTKAHGSTIRLVWEWDESQQTPPEFDDSPPPREERPPSEPASSARRSSPAPAVPATPAVPSEEVDPNVEFKNDPFIKKALEVFQSTLQTPQS